MSVGILHNWAKHPLKRQIEFIFFSLSLSGPAITYFYTRIGEQKITNLTTIRQRTNESGTEFLQRFQETRNLCFSLNLADDQLAALAVQGMLPTWRENLLGQEFDNFGQLAQQGVALNSQF